MNNAKEKTQTKQVAAVEPFMVRAKLAAALCSVSVRQWQSMISSGQCPPSIKIGGCRLWRLDIVRLWVALDCPGIDKFEKLIKARGIIL